MAIIPQMALASVKRFGMCFMQCKDALFWHYVSTAPFVGLENHVGCDSFIGCCLEHPRVGTFDYSRFCPAPRVGFSSGQSIFETLPGNRTLECGHDILDCQCPSIRSHCYSIH